MLVDSRLEFSDAQDVTSTAVSTNVIDLFAVGGDQGFAPGTATPTLRNIGPGRPLWVVLTVDTAITAGTTPTVDVDLQTDADEAFSDPTVIASFRQLDDTNGVAGARFVLGFPYSNERFLRLNYTAGGTVATGAVSAWLTDQEPFDHSTYQDAVN